MPGPFGKRLPRGGVGARIPKWGSAGRATNGMIKKPGKLFGSTENGTGPMTYRNLFRVCVVFAAALAGASAVSGDGGDADAALIRSIEDNLIAPCCWTQPISEHESDVSDQMRREVRAMVAAGMSREAILDHFVALYGERVLAAPRPEGFNRLAYILPWAALGVGGGILFLLLRKLRAPAPDAPPETAADAPPETAADARYRAVIEKELQDLEGR